MNPRDFCKVARRLASSADAGDLRTATGRAYYAAFNVGVELIDPIVPVNRGPGGHRQIIRLLQNCVDPGVNTIGTRPAWLHSQRNVADYEMGSNRGVEDHKTVSLLVDTAEDFIETIDAAFAGANSKPIMKSMQDFWINVERGLLRGRPRIV